MGIERETLVSRSKGQREGPITGCCERASESTQAPMYAAFPVG